MADTERTVWLVRHGNRADFADERWLLSAPRPHDPPLSPDGVVQAKETGRRLAAEPIDHVFASPFLRAAETACHIAEAIGLPVRIEHGLCEALLTGWFPVEPDFISTAELAVRLPRIDLGYSTAVTPQYPETEADTLARTARTIRSLIARWQGNLLLVSHGAAIHGLCSALIEGRPHIHPALCCLIKIVERDGRWTVERDGTDIAHLSSSECNIRFM